MGRQAVAGAKRDGVAGGVFVAGSLAWGMVADGFTPDRYDITGAIICLVGVAVIMYAPRSA
ncbi:hypothetical protein GCM10027599_23690 [Yimella radicis]